MCFKLSVITCNHGRCSQPAVGPAHDADLPPAWTAAPLFNPLTTAQPKSRREQVPCPVPLNSHRKGPPSLCPTSERHAVRCIIAPPGNSTLSPRSAPSAWARGERERKRNKPSILCLRPALLHPACTLLHPAAQAHDRPSCFPPSFLTRLPLFRPSPIVIPPRLRG